MPGPRSREERTVDTLSKLEESGADVWVATSGMAGAHLVPLSYAWRDERVLVACEESSVTARNIQRTGTARLGLGPTRDVVMIDVTLDRFETVTQTSAEIAQAYATQAGWDARSVPSNLMLYLKPERIQAWREADEIEGRTLMRDGTWLT